MSYFKEIEEFKTYSGEQADFHFTYNANSGGGQAFLGGKYYDANGDLVSPQILDGKVCVFKFPYVTASGEEISVVLDDIKAKYEIKPRGTGSTSMKLGIGNDRTAPSKVISSFMMLPPTCGVKTPTNLDVSILSSQNYWLQSMWLKCNIDERQPNEVQLIPLDLVFGGGTKKDKSERSCRYFCLDVNKRILDIISLSNTEKLFSTEISQILKLFSDIYLGNATFQYDECSVAVNRLMIQLAIEYPASYSGITDPLPVLIDIARKLANKSAKSSYATSFARNRILFGAPGTGKSYVINQDKDALLKNGGEYERVTFHPDYSYANFVGTYKPTMLESVNDLIASEDEKRVLSVLLDDRTAQEKYDLLYDKFKDGDLTRLPLLLGLYNDDKFKTKKKDGSDASGDNSVERNHGRAIRPYVNLISDKKSASEIAYEYVPGPFMRTYVKALKNAQSDNPKPYLLIVEEINRANVAAVFGDVFQLLDRNDDNVSEYAIQASEDIKKYLAKELNGNPQEYSEIKIPGNMFIWATMNSADQGVFPMDTAFKRRWNFDYLGINHNENDIKGNFVTMGDGVYQSEIEWNELRKAINNTLSSYKVNEDKLLGPYFLSRKIVVPSAGNKINADIFISAFKSKVLMYLFDDAAKQKRASLFDGCKDATRYSSICEEFDRRGIEIFCKDIREKFPRTVPIAGVAESVEEYK